MLTLFEASAGSNGERRLTIPLLLRSQCPLQQFYLAEMISGMHRDLEKCFLSDVIAFAFVLERLRARDLIGALNVCDELLAQLWPILFIDERKIRKGIELWLALQAREP